MKFENSENQIRQILKGCFSNVPSVRGWEILPQPAAKTNAPQPDAVAEVRFQDRSFRLIIEVKSIGQPRQARAAIAQLLNLSSQAIRSYPLFIAPYISPDAAKLCRESGVGYADLAGNCCIAFEDIYILREGRPNQFISTRKLKSLYQPAASRVLRVLLFNPKMTWKIIPLTKEAGVSAGTVSNVRRALLDREWIEKENDGIQLKDPKALLDDWADNYSFRKNAVHDFYSLKSVNEIEEAIASAYSSISKTRNYRESVRYALTAFSAAARWAPSVRTNRVFAYINEDINILAEKISLKPVPSGANVTLLEPYDQGVFYGSEVINGVQVVAPIQAYLDLINFKGRGEEAAQHLLKTVIQKRW